MNLKALTIAAAMAGLVLPSVSFAQNTTKENAPGQQMQNPNTKPLQKGPGASGYAPGRQERTQGSKGASEYAPGRGGVTSKPVEGNTGTKGGRTR